ncbi:MAG: hypothetical protein KJ915_09940 [Candidatus Omnitrophica bacterium]|nr:hypothetical protein [Candidatus Omnitrophota bacterium]
MIRRRLFISIICAFIVLFFMCNKRLLAEDFIYTIISSDSTDAAVVNLQKSLSTMLGQDILSNNINYNSPEAKKIINQLGIKLIPYIVFEKEAGKYDKFSEMARKGMVVKKEDKYVIPDKMLFPLGVMFLERTVKERQLDVFMMSQCPLGNDALNQLDTYLSANPGIFDINVHYMVEFSEFGVSSKRGPEEVKEAIRQILIQKYYPDKFWQYRRAVYLQKKDSKAACNALGIDHDIVDSKKEEGIALLKGDFNLCNELNIDNSVNYSPTFLWENNRSFPSMRQLSEHIMQESFSNSEKGKMQDGVLPIIVFYGPRCPHCRKFLEKQVPELEKEFGDKISFVFYNIQTPQHAERKMEMEAEYGVKKIDHIPQVYIAGHALVGSRQINKELRNIIKKDVNIKKKSISEEINISIPINSDSYLKKISERFHSFTLIAITSSGLLDGINPCAFSTIVFFMSFLVFAKFSFRRMALVGGFFILAVFITYLGLGLGVFVWLEKIKTFVIISEYFDLIIGGITILLGVASLYDYFIYTKNGTSKGVLLKLPSVVKKNIHLLIGTLRDKGTAGMVKLLLFSFGLGVIVSLLESVCTGQVYVPILSFMIKMNMSRWKAFLYLLLYNLMFILPLIVVFLSTLFGINSKWWAKFVQTNVGRIKLITAIFFFTIGALIMLI